MIKKMATNSKAYNKANYKKYWWTDKAKKDRATRNKARKRAEKAGKVKKGDGKEVDHKKALAKWGSNKTSNTRVLSRKKNRQLGAKIANDKKWKGYKKAKVIKTNKK